jgi:hypothetical protein
VVWGPGGGTKGQEQEQRWVMQADWHPCLRMSTSNSTPWLQLNGLVAL